MRRCVLPSILTAGVLALSACTNASEQTTPKNLTDALAAVHTDDALRARLPAAIQSKGTLTVGSDTSYPPAEFLGGPDGRTPVGFDVDLAKAIAGTLGLRLEWQTATFDSILPAVGPKYDLGMSAFTITKARYRAVDFVSYMRAGRTWAVQSGNPTGFNPASACGAKVGVQTGTTAVTDLQKFSKACVAAGKPAIASQEFPKQTDVITRLVNGSIDATYSGLTTLGYAVKQSGGKLETIGELTTVDANGIALSKSDPAWSKLVADTVDKLIADGVYGQILTGWGLGGAAITDAEVNPASYE